MFASSKKVCISKWKVTINTVVIKKEDELNVKLLIKLKSIVKFNKDKKVVKRFIISE